MDVQPKKTKGKSGDFGARFERLFAELCGQRFLKGFVFHSPKFYNPTEEEAGDVTLWIRRMVVNFELVSQNSALSNSTKKFVRKIGHKRDQLIRDRATFHDPEIEIQFQNELNQTVVFDKSDLQDCSYSGVVLVDCEIPLEKMHFESFKKSMKTDFPLAIMTLDGFRDLMTEVDTIPDLVYYLEDRHHFVNTVFRNTPNVFLDLNRDTEKSLISFYKLNENQFVSEQWSESATDHFPTAYKSKWSEHIEARNAENEVSEVIDDIADYLRQLGSENAKLHAWELAMLSRRQRAVGIGPKVRDALIQLPQGREKRYFAYFNQATGCWLLFYFRYGGTPDEFRDELDVLAMQKLLVEIAGRDFEYSVFGYGFRKSTIETGTSFDDVWLTIADADKVARPLRPRDLEEAQLLFHGGKPSKLKEFPDAD